MIKDILETLGALQNTPVPNLLVIAGFIFLLLAFVGKIGAIVTLPEKRQKLAGSIGFLLLLTFLKESRISSILLPTTKFCHTQAGAGGGASLPADELQFLRGQILVLRAQQAYFNNQPIMAIEFCQQVLALLPPSWTFVRGGAMLFLGMSMQASDQALEAERLLLAEYESCGDKTDAYALLLLRSLAFIYLQKETLFAGEDAQPCMRSSQNLPIYPFRRYRLERAK
jgi:hypothetical protein